MTRPVFRVGDVAKCPKHGPGVAVSAPSGIRVNGRALRKVGDAIVCTDGSMDRLGSGAATVRVLGTDWAGRLGDETLHGGTVMLGSTNVRIGGPSATGCVGKLKTACQAMAAGRNPPKGAVGPDGKQLPPHTAEQSYNNCGMEAMRMLIRQATGNRVDQESFFDYMIDNYTSPEARKKRGRSGKAAGRDSKLPKDRYRSGGTHPDEQIGGLRDFGVEAEQFEQTPAAIQKGVKEGKGIMAGVWMDMVDPPPGSKGTQTGPHVLVIIGVVYDEHGRAVAYIVNNPASGCGIQYPAAQIERALTKRGIMTKKPIW